MRLQNILKLVVGILIAADLVYILFPILSVILISLDPRDYVFGFPPGLSLRWYAYFINYEDFMVGLKTSFIISGSVTIISTIIGMMASLALVRHKFKGKEVLNTVFLSPIIIPALVSGVAMLTFFKQIGLLNSFINLMIGHMIITVPYSIRTISATLIGFDRSIEEAAKILGADEIKTFMKVTFPIIKPGVLAAMVFSFAWSMNDYAVSIFLSDYINFTFSVALFSYIKAVFDPAIAVASVLLMAMTVLLVFIIEKSMGLDRLVGLW